MKISPIQYLENRTLLNATLEDSSTNITDACFTDAQEADLSMTIVRILNLEDSDAHPNASSMLGESGIQFVSHTPTSWSVVESDINEPAAQASYSAETPLVTSVETPIHLPIETNISSQQNLATLPPEWDKDAFICKFRQDLNQHPETWPPLLQAFFHRLETAYYDNRDLPSVSADSLTRFISHGHLSNFSDVIIFPLLFMKAIEHGIVLTKEEMLRWNLARTLILLLGIGVESWEDYSEKQAALEKIWEYELATIQEEATKRILEKLSSVPNLSTDAFENAAVALAEYESEKLHNLSIIKIAAEAQLREANNHLLTDSFWFTEKSCSLIDKLSGPKAAIWLKTSLSVGLYGYNIAFGHLYNYNEQSRVLELATQYAEDWTKAGELELAAIAECIAAQQAPMYQWIFGTISIEKFIVAIAEAGIQLGLVTALQIGQRPTDIFKYSTLSIAALSAWVKFRILGWDHTTLESGVEAAHNQVQQLMDLVGVQSPSIQPALREVLRNDPAFAAEALLVRLRQDLHQAQCEAPLALGVKIGSPVADFLVSLGLKEGAILALAYACAGNPEAPKYLMDRLYM